MYTYAHVYNSNYNKEYIFLLKMHKCKKSILNRSICLGGGVDPISAKNASLKKNCSVKMRLFCVVFSSLLWSQDFQKCIFFLLPLEVKHSQITECTCYFTKILNNIKLLRKTEGIQVISSTKAEYGEDRYATIKVQEMYPIDSWTLCFRFRLYSSF